MYRVGSSLQQEPEFGTLAHCRTCKQINTHGILSFGQIICNNIFCCCPTTSNNIIIVTSKEVTDCIVLCAEYMVP